MSINLGQVAAIVTRTSLPATELNAIIRLVDGSDNLLDFYQWDPSSTSWIAFSTLFAAVHLGGTAPADTSKVWLDNSVDPYLIKTYNSSAEQWVTLNNIRSINIIEDTILNPSHNNAFLNVSINDPVIITISDNVGDEFVTQVTRLTGQVTLVPEASEQLNGVNGPLDILNVYRSASIRKLDTNQFIVEGDI